MIEPRLRRVAVAAVAIVATAGCAAPLPSPTPPVTPSPVQASPNPNLVEFTAHMQEGTPARGGLVRDLAAASAGGQLQLELAARRLVEWTDAEVAWLEDHPPDACYEDAWQTYATGVDDFATAASDLLSHAEAPSPPTEAEAQAAAAALGSGSQAFEAAGLLAGEARAACR
ncbi:MAG TPA: hypothetical protein VFO05_12290 [Candidatus Limnocylindrales bacterium]|nr:hypothetical protein [Candidatus Limnocylindrales bacterium]